MSDYIDTSALVAWLTIEAGSPNAIAWMESNAGADLVISDWSITEFAAALSRKLRKTEIDTSQRAEATATFTAAARLSLGVVAVQREHFQEAAQFASIYKLGLRSADALHLAVARSASARIVTLDKRQAEAAEALGIASLLL